MVKEPCAQCKKFAECNFGMHGDTIAAYFCSVDCMVAYAKEHQYQPFGGRLNVKLTRNDPKANL